MKCVPGNASGPTDPSDCTYCHDRSSCAAFWNTDPSQCSSRRLEVEPPLDTAQGRSLSETMGGAIDAAANALRSAVWIWFAAPGFWILFLMLLGVAFGTASIAGSGNRCHATTGSVFLGIASFFSILGTISGIAMGVSFMIGAQFLSAALLTAAGKSSGIDCSGSSPPAVCACVTSLDGLLHNLGVGGWLTFVVLLFTSIVAIGGASSLSARASETQATQLMAVGVEINPNQLPGPQKVGGNL